MSFADATSVRSSGNGKYTAELRRGWDVMGITNGGYLAAIAGRAMQAHSGDRALISITSHFMNPGRAGPVEVSVERLKSGRRFTTARAVISADGKPLISATGSLIEPDSIATEVSLLEGAPPDLPPPDRCTRASSGDGPFPPPIVDEVDLRVHPDDVGGGIGEPTGSALFRGWFRLLDGEPVDQLAIVLSTDIFPPAIFNTDHPMSWTPTLDLTVHVRNPGPHDWLMCQFRTRFVTGGFLEEDGEIWDGNGDLVALSRQLAVVGS